MEFVVEVRGVEVVLAISRNMVGNSKHFQYATNPPRKLTVLVEEVDSQMARVAAGLILSKSAEVAMQSWTGPRLTMLWFKTIRPSSHDRMQICHHRQVWITEEVVEDEVRSGAVHIVESFQEGEEPREAERLW